MHDLTPAAELLHGDDEVIYVYARYQGIAKIHEMAGAAAEFRVAMRPGKRQVLPETPMAGCRISFERPRYMSASRPSSCSG